MYLGAVGEHRGHGSPAGRRREQSTPLRCSDVCSMVPISVVTDADDCLHSLIKLPWCLQISIIRYFPSLDVHVGVAAPHNETTSPSVNNQQFMPQTMQRQCLRSDLPHPDWFQLSRRQRRSVRLSRQRGARQTLAMKTPDGPSVAIVGVSGAVGQEFLRVSAPAAPAEAMSVFCPTGAVANTQLHQTASRYSSASTGAQGA